MLKNNGFHNRHSPILRAFSPLSLFAGGAPGAWYDPSDLTTLFQDSAGTTPVTAVEQPVGLMLDKSQGLVLGSELVAQPINFTSGWNLEGGIVVDSNTFSTTATGGISITLTSPQGKYLEVKISAQENCVVYFGTDVSTRVAVGANGIYRVRWPTTELTSRLYLRNASAGTTDVTLLSVKELAGNHAFQATSASRPVLSARYNLLTKTEQFYITGSPWFASGFSTSSTANNLIPSTSSVAHTWGQSVTATIGTVLVAKCWIKPNGYNTAVLQLGGCTGTPTAFFNASTGVITSQTGSPAATMVLQSDGYYECTISGVASSTTPGLVSYVVALDNTTLVFAGDGTSGLLYQKASLVPANQSSIPYQRVNTATDYDTTGFLPYLRFDGVDDSLSTNSISFTATDKMSVFAGVRKLSDAAIGVPVELSANTSANTGAFVFAAPATTANANYFWGSRGSAALVGATTTNSFASPITNVFTGLGDISGDLSALRLNGAQVAQSTADQGSGNYGNYPLYIGRRNNASLPFNGQLYSMVIVGKAVTAGELSSTETYVNQKTGAY